MTSYVLVPRQILHTIQTERARYLPRETGGFLIGLRRDPHIEVTGLTLQGPRDLATGNSFERRCVSHRTQIHAAWQRSDHIESLVGDWHSHSFDTADASGIDQSAWRTLVQTSQRGIIGLIDAGIAVPKLYYAGTSRRVFAPELQLVEQDAEHLVFATDESLV